MSRIYRAFVVTMALAVTACNPTESPDYAWEKTPSSQLQAVSGLVLGVSQKGKTPARISLVCSRTQSVHIVIRGRLSDWKLLDLPRRDVVEVHIGSFEGQDFNAARAGATTIRDGAVGSSVSDELSEKTLDRIIFEASEDPDGRVVAFGIRETFLYFDLKTSPAELRRFVSSCRART